MKDGYREKVILADKMPIWLAKTEEDLEKFFSKQLQRLDVEYIDMYLIHNIIKPNWRKNTEAECAVFLEQKKLKEKSATSDSLSMEIWSLFSRSD